MKKSTWSRDLLVMLAALCVAGVAVVWVQRITGRIDGVAMLIFMLAVFVTSMYTDGYLWGVLASLASVLAVNFAFFTPYFAFNFTLPENLFSGLVMLAVSIMTSTLTTRVKKQEPSPSSKIFSFENGVLRLPSVLIDGNGKINASLSEIAFLTLQRLNEP